MIDPNTHIPDWTELPGPHDVDLTKPCLDEIDEDIYKDR